MGHGAWGMQLDVFAIAISVAIVVWHSREAILDDRSPTSSGNESDDSSDVETPLSGDADAVSKTAANELKPEAAASVGGPKSMPASLIYQTETGASTSTAAATAASVVSTASPATAAAPDRNYVYPATSFANIPPDMLRHLIQSGQLQIHAEEDGNQYVTIPLSSTVASYIKGKSTTGASTSYPTSEKSTEKTLSIKQEYD
ncbi:hypothetical protein AWZ03_011037 [Drosophila navojoa]|uniref:Uncharacterized protein n=1 Tax=Drosophila navojoa TaxID=7232 RepID=A0A484B1F7_DRONA|nr:hypothetical protein AWZ03_011037 [Drosophila navojoa]